jgi:ABC-type molybdate transport system substrate-binding protein
MRRSWHVLVVAIVAFANSASGRAQTYPPWSKGENNPASDKGFVFSVSDIDNVPDLHGNPEGAKLVLFIGGNQFFVLPQLIAVFETQHPELRGRNFYETLPPGILAKQMGSNNTVTVGNLTLHVVPDVYEAGQRAMLDMTAENRVDEPVSYATNDLMIMVGKSNPKQIRSLRDLGNPALRLAMPNPDYEGVAKQIGDSLRKAGDEQLFQTVYKIKVQDGSTYLTQIHHRQTPMRIMKGDSDAGVTWSSEVRFQEKIGNPIAGVAIPPEQNTTATYSAAVVRGAPHLEAARAWVLFLKSPEAQAIYKEFGFGPVK